MASSNNPINTEQIVKDITCSSMSSYQIAHKYNLTKMTVDRIAKTHLGEEIFQKKELLALESLKSRILDLKTNGSSIQTIGEKLGLSKSTVFNLIKKYEAESEKEDEIIQIDSIPMVDSPLSEDHPNRNSVTNIKGSFHKVSEELWHLPAVPSSQGRVKEHHYHKNEYSVIRIKGLQISFDANAEGMGEIISKVLRVLQ